MEKLPFLTEEFIRSLQSKLRKGSFHRTRRRARRQTLFNEHQISQRSGI